MTVAEQRILRGTTATLTVTLLDSAGAAADASGAVTVTVTRADGTVIATAAATTNPTGTGTYGYALTPAQTSTLDLLTAVWTDAGDGSTWTTYHEVVGGYFFTIDEARAADSSLQDEAKYPDADIIAARRIVEDDFEDICGVAFVPRYSREVLSGDGSDRLMVKPYTRAVRSVRYYSDWATETYSEFTADELAAVQWDDDGILTAAWWPYGTRNLVVEYEHGHDRLPAPLKAKAVKWLRMILNESRSGIPDRASSVVQEGGTTYRLDMPSITKTGVPDIDAKLQRYSMRVPAIG